MTSSIQTGDYVHVVATVDVKAKAGKILYVNPSTSTIQSDAPAEAGVELLVADRDGNVLYRQPVVVRRSSCDPGQANDVGLIQADIPRLPGMKSVALLVDGAVVNRFEAGETAPAASGARPGLAAMAGPSLNRRGLTLDQAADLQPAPGITYSVLVKPDTGGPWNTIAVGRPTPKVEIDRNQFAGAKKADIRVLRTTGFEEDVIAEGTVDLF